MAHTYVVLTDEPQWSSASLCITLNHLGQSFRPDYTHQLIEGEYFRGHRPCESVLQAAISKFNSIKSDDKDNNTNDASRGSDNGSDGKDNGNLGEVTTISSVSKSLLHKSHEYHDSATSELDIQVSISPSCQNCSVNIIRHHSTNDDDDDDEGQRTAKRPKVDKNNSKSQQQVSLSLSSDKTASADPNTTSSLLVNDAEILLALSKALPPIISQNSNSNNNNNNNNNENISSNNDLGSSNEGLLTTRNGKISEEDFLSEPIGEILDEYSFLTTTTTTTTNDKPPTIPNSTHNFVLTIADGKSQRVSEYHSSIERLALFYIENADTVNVANTNGGYWKILYIWKKDDNDDNDGNDKDSNNNNIMNDDDKNKNKNKNKKNKYSLVGYFTLFHFIALFHKPEPGLIIRICQALVLPPFQGQGHGKRLLEAVNNLAHQHQEEKDDDNVIHHKIVQINVEDPAPAFVALRNKVDWKLIFEHYEEWNWPSKGTISSSSNDDELSLFFTALTEREASEMSTKAKITPKQIHIMNDLLKLQALRSFCDNNDKAERCFRLMIKRRLNREYCNELTGLPTKEDQKLMLGKLFDEELKQYERILRSSTSTRI